MKYFLKNYADSNPALSKHLFHSSHNDTSGNAASSSSSESDDDHDDNEPCTSGEKVSCDSDDGDAHHTRLLQQSILSANEWSGSRRKYAKLLMIFARQQYGDEAVLNATVSNGEPNDPHPPKHRNRNVNATERMLTANALRNEAVKDAGKYLNVVAPLSDVGSNVLARTMVFKHDSTFKAELRSHLTANGKVKDFVGLLKEKIESNMCTNADDSEHRSRGGYDLVAIGLESIFSILLKLNEKNAELCVQALQSLLRLLQSLGAEALAGESPVVVGRMHALLRQLRIEGNACISSYANACMISLAIAYGHPQFIFATVNALLCDSRRNVPFNQQSSEKSILPKNFHALALFVERSLRYLDNKSTATGVWPPAGRQRSNWFRYSLSEHQLFCSFRLDADAETRQLFDERDAGPPSGNSTATAHQACLASNGSFLFILTRCGLFKIGTGLTETRRGHVVERNALLRYTDGSALYACDESLYLRRYRSARLWALDVETLREIGEIQLPTVVLTDGVLYTDGRAFYHATFDGLWNFVSTPLDDAFVPIPSNNSGTAKMSGGFSAGSPSRQVIRLVTVTHTTFGELNAFQRAAIDSIPSHLQAASVDLRLDANIGVLLTRHGKVYYIGSGDVLDLPDAAEWSLVELIPESIVSLTLDTASGCLILRSGAGNLWTLGSMAQFADGSRQFPPVSHQKAGASTRAQLSARHSDDSSGTPANERKARKIRIPNKRKCVSVTVAAGCLAYATENGRCYFHGRHVVTAAPSSINSTAAQPPPPLAPAVIPGPASSAVGFDEPMSVGSAERAATSAIRGSAADALCIAGLKGVAVAIVHLGKTHAVIVSKTGLLYTCGMNNLNQCGRRGGTAGRPAPGPVVHSPPQSTNPSSSVASKATAPATAVAAVTKPERLPSPFAAAASSSTFCEWSAHTWAANVRNVCRTCERCSECGASASGAALCLPLSPSSHLAMAGASIVAEQAPSSPTTGIRVLSTAAARSPRTTAGAHHRVVAAPRRQCECETGAAGDSASYTNGNKELWTCCRSCGLCRVCAEALLTPAIRWDLTRRGQTAGPSSADGMPSSIVQPLGRVILSTNPCTDIKVAAVSVGNYHTVVLCADHQVYTFGSNCHGQLGTGDIARRAEPFRLNLPANVQVVQAVAGANHCVLRTSDGRIITFGAHRSGQLGRGQHSATMNGGASASKSNNNNNNGNGAGKYWFAEPTFVEDYGPATGRIATWVGAHGDQTLVQCQSQIFTKSELANCHITANASCIMIFSRGMPTAVESAAPTAADSPVGRYVVVGRDHQAAAGFGGLMKSAADSRRKYSAFCCFDLDRQISVGRRRCHVHRIQLNGHCLSLDPRYSSLLWGFDARRMRVFALSDSVTGRRCGARTADASASPPLPQFLLRHRRFIQTPELLLPSDESAETRFSDTQMAIYLLSMFYSLCVSTAAGTIHSTGASSPTDDLLSSPSSRRSNRRASSAVLVLNRFEGHGGGWGYSAHCVEAVQFKANREITLHGVGLFGGRGEYTAKLKIFRVIAAAVNADALGAAAAAPAHFDEHCVELLADTDEMFYACLPRETAFLRLPKPVAIRANHWHVVWAQIHKICRGPSSDCGAGGRAAVRVNVPSLHADNAAERSANKSTGCAVEFHFQNSLLSNNGTDVEVGQIPELHYSLVGGPPDGVGGGRTRGRITTRKGREVLSEASDECGAEGMLDDRPASELAPPSSAEAIELIGAETLFCVADHTAVFAPLFRILRWSIDGGVFATAARPTDDDNSNANSPVPAASRTTLEDNCMIASASGSVSDESGWKRERAAYVAIVALRLIRLYIDAFHLAIRKRMAKRVETRRSRRTASAVSPPSSARKPRNRRRTTRRSDEDEWDDDDEGGRVGDAAVAEMTQRFAAAVAEFYAACSDVFRRADVQLNEEDTVGMVLVGETIDAYHSCAPLLFPSVALLHRSLSATLFGVFPAWAPLGGGGSGAPPLLAANRWKLLALLGAFHRLRETYISPMLQLSSAGDCVDDVVDNDAEPGERKLVARLIQHFSERNTCPSSSSPECEDEAGTSSSTRTIKMEPEQLLKFLFTLAFLSEDDETVALSASCGSVSSRRLKGNVLSRRLCAIAQRLLSAIVRRLISAEMAARRPLGALLFRTPTRFRRRVADATWSTGTGARDAIAFRVDAPGIRLHGAGVYLADESTGSGGGDTDQPPREYELELLVNRGASSTECWTLVERMHGRVDELTVVSEDTSADVAVLPSLVAAQRRRPPTDNQPPSARNQWLRNADELSGGGSSGDGGMALVYFRRAVPLSVSASYAVRLRLSGGDGKTTFGEGGVSSIRLQNGARLILLPCSLSDNGTTVVRGQLPCFVYSVERGSTEGRRGSAAPPELKRMVEAVNSADLSEDTAVEADRPSANDFVGGGGSGGGANGNREADSCKSTAQAPLVDDDFLRRMPVACRLLMLTLRQLARHLSVRLVRATHSVCATIHFSSSSDYGRATSASLLSGGERRLCGTLLTAANAFLELRPQMAFHVVSALDDVLPLLTNINAATISNFPTNGGGDEDGMPDEEMHYYESDDDNDDDDDDDDEVLNEDVTGLRRKRHGRRLTGGERGRNRRVVRRQTLPAERRHRPPVELEGDRNGNSLLSLSSPPPPSVRPSASSSTMSSVLSVSRPNSQQQATVESPHPYKSGQIYCQSISFPAHVEFMCLRFHDECATANASDTLFIYAGAANAERFLIGRFAAHASTTCRRWPRSADGMLFVPGRRLTFVFETSPAAGGLADDEAEASKMYGYRCTVDGISSSSSFSAAHQKSRRRPSPAFPLLAVEQEFAWLCANACRLMAQAEDADDACAAGGSGMKRAAGPLIRTHGQLLRRGLNVELPTLKEVLSGNESRGISSNGAGRPKAGAEELQCLRDFIAGAPETAGGTLARAIALRPYVDEWTSRLAVEPLRDDESTPWGGGADVIVGCPVKIIFVPKSQHDTLLTVEDGAMTVEVVVVYGATAISSLLAEDHSDDDDEDVDGSGFGNLEEAGRRSSRPVNESPENRGGGEANSWAALRALQQREPYRPVYANRARYLCITASSAFANRSLEELRFAFSHSDDRWASERGGARAAALHGSSRSHRLRLSAESKSGGTSSACRMSTIWRPPLAGRYALVGCVDGRRLRRAKTVDVRDATTVTVASQGDGVLQTLADISAGNAAGNELASAKPVVNARLSPLSPQRQQPPSSASATRHQPLETAKRAMCNTVAAFRGVRIRAHPTLSGVGGSDGGGASPNANNNQIGVITRGTIFGYVETLRNTDGVWLRLADEDRILRTNDHRPNAQAWCLQYNKHLGVEYLVCLRNPPQAATADNPLTTSHCDATCHRTADASAHPPNAEQNGSGAGVGELVRQQANGPLVPQRPSSPAAPRRPTAERFRAATSQRPPAALSPAVVRCARAVYAAHLWSERDAVRRAVAVAAQLRGSDGAALAETLRRAERTSAMTRGRVVDALRGHPLARQMVAEWMAVSEVVLVLIENGVVMPSPLPPEEVEVSKLGGGKLHRNLESIYAMNLTDRILAPAENGALRDAVPLPLPTNTKALRVRRGVGASGANESEEYCELCACWFRKPITGHMRAEHPGCGGPSFSHGYNSVGNYTTGWTGQCGEGGHGNAVWYLMCPACRTTYLKKSSPLGHPEIGTAGVNSMDSDAPIECPRAESSMVVVDRRHRCRVVAAMLTRNAMFLLELKPNAAAPLTSATDGWRIDMYPEQGGFPSAADFARGAADKGDDIFRGLAAVAEANVAERRREPNEVDEVDRFLDEFGAESEENWEGAEEEEANYYTSLTQTSDPGYGLVGGRRLTDEEDDNDEDDMNLINQLSSLSASANLCRRETVHGRVGAPERHGGGLSRRRPQTSQSRRCRGATRNGVPPRRVDENDRMTAIARALRRRPTLAFVAQVHDLHALRALLRDALARAVRFSYAFRVWNWLLKLVTSESSVSDIVWHYLTALSSYDDVDGSAAASSTAGVAATQPLQGIAATTATAPPIQQFASRLRLLPHPGRVCALAGDAATARLVADFHALLTSLAVILRSESVRNVALKCLCFRAWTFQLTVHEKGLLVTLCNLLATVGSVLADSGAVGASLVSAGAVGASENLSTQRSRVAESIAVTEELESVPVKLDASSRPQLLPCLADGSCETFWESGNEERARSRRLTIRLDADTLNVWHPEVLAIFIDNPRDDGFCVLQVSVRSTVRDADGGLASALRKDDARKADFAQLLYNNANVSKSFVGWLKCGLPYFIASATVQITLRGDEAGCRVRQLLVLGRRLSAPPPATVADNADAGRRPNGNTLKPSASHQLLFSAAQLDAFQLFQAIAAQAFSDDHFASADDARNGGGGGAGGDGNALRAQVFDMLFSRVQLQPLQHYVFAQMVSALEREVVNLRERGKRNYSYVCGLMVMLMRISDLSATVSSHVAATGLTCAGPTTCGSSSASVGGAELPPPTTATTSKGSGSGMLVVLSEMLLFAPQAVQFQVLDTIERLLGRFRPEEVDVRRLVRNIVAVVAKAVTLQLKERPLRRVEAVTLTSHALDIPDFWRADRTVSVDVARLLAQTLRRLAGGDDAGGAASDPSKLWAVAIRREIAETIMQLTRPVTASHDFDSPAATAVPTGDVSQRIRTACFWLSVAALAVIADARWLELSTTWRALSTRQREQADSLCENHDDGRTVSQVHCDDCRMELCRECFTILHLNRRKRNHAARLVGSAAAACPRVDIHDGCTRLRVNAQLLVLFNALRLSGVVELGADALGGAGPPTVGGSGDGDNNTADGLRIRQMRAGRPSACGSAGVGQPSIGRGVLLQQRQQYRHTSDVFAMDRDVSDVDGRVAAESADDFDACADDAYYYDEDGMFPTTTPEVALPSPAWVPTTSGGCGVPIATASASSASAATTCRFCGTRLNTDFEQMRGVCAYTACGQLLADACTVLHPCGHWCAGVCGERVCLPCLHCGDGGAERPDALRQDADDLCAICYTERLAEAPCIRLAGGCAHIFHYRCVRRVLEKRWMGARITFRFMQCPLCNAQIDHSTLRDLLDPLEALQADVAAKAKLRLEYDGLLNHTAIVSPDSAFYGNPTGYAMDRYVYILCAKCRKAYFGGENRCMEQIDTSHNFDPNELLCGGCSNVAGEGECGRHGAEYLEHKCRYCCSVAVYFCFGTTHFCAGCHADFPRLISTPKHQLPKCPVAPRSIQLPDTDACPLKLRDHPPTGEEFSLGCGICRNLRTF